MMAEDKGVSITRFNGKNYRQWKFQIKCNLKYKGLYEHIAEKTAKTDMNKEWTKNDAHVMSILSSALELEQICLIENADTAFDIISKLDSIYEKKTELNKMLIYEQLYNYKIETGNMASHITRLESLARQLREAGETISDAAIITRIIGSLPSHYNSFRQAWLSMDESKQTINNLIARLLDEEARGDNDQQIALAVSKTEPKKSKWKPTCYNCNRKGHLSKDCWQPKKNQQQTETSSTSGSSQNYYSAFITSSEEYDNWILDSGASGHMSYRKDWFATLEDSSAVKNVCVGNNMNLKVCGEGTKKIEKFIDGQWHDSIINNVLYVPELRRNLFSKGVLAKAVV